LILNARVRVSSSVERAASAKISCDRTNISYVIG
jgi:hypothetical protein